MKTSERVLEFLKQQGFCPEVDPNNGNIFFKYQMRSFIFINNDEDEDFFQLALPGIFDVTEDNRELALEACNKTNFSIKVIKCCIPHDDVWVFLMQYKNPWGYSNKELLTLYRGATADGECPLMVEKGLPSCGKSRFGCWVCTMVEKDKSMEAMIANDEEKAWMTPLLEFRNRFGDEEHDRERRSFRKMSGYLQGSYKQLHHGPYKKEVREQWLEELLIIQKDINDNGPEEFEHLELITLEELRNIRRIWVYDKHEFDDSLPGIYEHVMGIPFDDPDWIVNESFGKEEWDILSDVVSKMFPDEELSFEMAYSLIDIEKRSNSLNKRKGVLDELESCIQRTFYKNEEDATKFYIDQTQRKKDLGGKYNAKVLDSTYDDMEDEDDEE